MVDSDGSVLDNIVDFPSRMDKRLARAAIPDIEMPTARSLISARSGVAIDFRLPSLRGENEKILLIIGFSLIMAIVLTGTAFATASLTLKLLSVLASG